MNTPAPTLQRGGIQVAPVRPAIRGAIDGMGWATARGADKEQYNVCVATTTTATTTTTTTTTTKTTANTHADSGTSMSLNGGGAAGGDEKEVARSGEPRGEDKGDEKEARREEKGG